MKLIILILLSMFMIFTTAFAKHDADFEYKIIQRNQQFDIELVLLKSVAKLMQIQIEKEGIEIVVRRIITSPKKNYAYSDYAFLAVFENNCTIIFHAFNDNFSTYDFCSSADTIGAPNAIIKINKNGMTYTKFVMMHVKDYKLDNGNSVRAIIEYNMEGFILKYGKYAIIFNTFKYIEMGLPKNLKHIQNQNQIFAKKLKFI